MNYDSMNEYQKNIDNMFVDEYEKLAGYNCPSCGYPIVTEFGIDTCYRCGWFNENNQKDTA